MAQNKPPTVHHVTKQNGERWLIVYGSRGLNWVRCPNDFLDRSRGDDTPTRPIQPPSGITALDAVRTTIEASAQLLMAYEARQQRLMAEAAHEERRIVWLEEMLSRWAKSNAALGGMDLRAAEYVAREADGAFEAILGNRRVALPQSLLFDVAIAQQSVSELRASLAAQFQLMATGANPEVSDALREAYPNRSLNMQFVDELANDPALLWEEFLNTEKKPKNLHLSPELPSTSEDFMGKLFATTAVTKFQIPSEVEVNMAQKLRSLVVTILPKLNLTNWAPVAVQERADLFRELVIFPAEVARVKALHTAWMVVAESVAAVTGKTLAVLVGKEGMSLELIDAEDTEFRALPTASEEMRQLAE